MQRGRRRPCTVDDDAALFFLTHVPMGGEREWKPAVEGSQPGPPLQGGPGGDGDRKDHRRPSDSVFAPYVPACGTDSPSNPRLARGGGTAGPTPTACG